MDTGSHDVLSHSTHMTLKKRREWARVFIGAKHHGLSRRRILLFSIECARQLHTLMPVLVAMRLVLRAKPIRWRLLWAPRALGAQAPGMVTVLGRSDRLELTPWRVLGPECTALELF